MLPFALSVLNLFQAAKNACLRLVRGMEFETLNNIPLSFKIQPTDNEQIAETTANQNTELGRFTAKTLLYTYSAVTLASYGHTPVTTMMSAMATYDLAQNIFSSNSGQTRVHQ